MPVPIEQWSIGCDAALVDALDGVFRAENIPAAIGKTLSWTGPLLRSTFVDESAAFTMRFMVETQTAYVVFVNGVSRLSHVALIADSYIDPISPAAYSGAARQYALYGQLLVSELNAFRGLVVKPVVFVGHSYGCAAVQVAHRLFRFQSPGWPSRVVGIGGPKTMKGVSVPAMSRNEVALYSNVGDPVTHLMPLLTEAVFFWTVVPLHLIVTAIRYSHRGEVINLDDVGFSPAADGNPWASLAGVTDLFSLVEWCLTRFDTIHGTREYARRMGLAAARVVAGGAPPVEANPPPPPGRRPTLRDLEDAGVPPAGLPVNVPPAIGLSGKSNLSKRYRVKRCGKLWAVTRGGFMLGFAVNKRAGRRLAKAGTRQIRFSLDTSPAMPYTVDASLFSGYPGLWLKPGEK